MLSTEASLVIPLLIVLIFTCLLLWLYLFDTGFLEVFFTAAVFQEGDGLTMPYRVEGSTVEGDRIELDVTRRYFKEEHRIVREASLDRKELYLWIHLARQAMPTLETMKGALSLSSSY